MENICILLNGSIQYDQRVIKTIRSLSDFYFIDLFYVNSDNNDSDIFGSRVQVFGAHDSEYSNGIKKFLRNSFFFFEFNYFINCVKKKNKKYDYIWCNDLPTLYPGFKLSKYYKCKLIYDSHEIFNETLNQFFPTPRKLHHSIRLKFMQSTGKIIERYLVKRINTFVTVNESLKNYFVKEYNYSEPVHVIYNYPSNLNKIKQTNLNIRQELGLKKDDFVFIFQGTLNHGRGLLKMVKAFSLIDDNLIKLIVAGGGHLFSELNDFVINNKLESKIKMLGRIHSQQIFHYTVSSDCGINLIEDINLSKKFTTATKMFEYFQAGIPVLCTNIKENEIILSNYNAGFLTDNSVNNIKKKIIEMSRTKDYVKFKLKSKEASKEYSWENQHKILLEILKN